MPDYPPKEAIEAAGQEMKENPPRILAKTRAKQGEKAAGRQKVAIMLNKARSGRSGRGRGGRKPGRSARRSVAAGVRSGRRQGRRR